MIQSKALGAILLMLELLLFSVPSWAAEGFITKVPDAEGNYCHLKFPAIREESLYWDQPVLKDVSEGDIIDFYGPCDHDPLGREEVMRQRAFVQRERYRQHGSD